MEGKTLAYPRDMQDRALELYMESGSVTETYRKIREEYRGYPVPTEITVRKWVSNNKLPEVQKNIRTDALVHARATEIQEELHRQEEHKQKYRQLSEKASTQLFAPEGLKFNTAMDAARAMDMGIQGERKITEAQFNVQFIEDLFGAVVQIVKDVGLRREIALEFRKILAKYSELPG
jgi:murein L,D-transpeptidase YcbB/YkuD